MLRPKGDKGLEAFMQNLTVTHDTFWSQHFNVISFAQVHRIRCKSFLVNVQDDFYQVMRYVERNNLRANLLAPAKDWQWSSLWIQKFGEADHR